MKRSLLPLNALRAFDAAARHMSFKKAADDLAVTPAAISQQIRSLEEILGVELFKRTNRSLILTEAAQLALKPLKEGFESLEDAVGTLTNTSSANKLRVSVSPSFASKWIVPRLANFYEMHPDSIVKIEATMKLTDFAAQDIDIAIRYGKGHYPDLYSFELLKETIFPVCSPGLLHGGKAIEQLSDLINYTLIHNDGADDEDNITNWSMWLKAAGVTVREGLPALHFNTDALAVEAAVAGRGMALVRASTADEDLKSGRLVKPFFKELPTNFAHFVVCPKEKLKLERVQNFVNWLKDEVASDY